MIHVSVGGVDGETDWTFTTPSAAKALEFLRQVDHEGSTVAVVIRLDNEGGYRALELLAQADAPEGR